MKLYDGGIMIILVIVIVAAVAGSASYYWLGPDNAVEETAERVIEAETGVNIDLSPSTPEKK